MIVVCFVVPSSHSSPFASVVVMSVVMYLKSSSCTLIYTPPSWHTYRNNTDYARTAPCHSHSHRRCSLVPRPSPHFLPGQYQQQSRHTWHIVSSAGFRREGRGNRCSGRRMRKMRWMSRKTLMCVEVVDGVGVRGILRRVGGSCCSY